jgi:hypothetical protein
VPGSQVPDPDQTKKSKRAGALHCAYMIMKCKPQWYRSGYVHIIVSIGLDTAVVETDLEAVTAAAKCLQTVPIDMATDTVAGGMSLHTASQAAVPTLQTVLSGCCGSDDESSTRRWFSVCEECTHALFHIHPAPEKLVTQIAALQFANMSASAVASPSLPMNSALGPGLRSAGGGQVLLSSVTSLAKFLFLIGQRALCSLLLIEKMAKQSKNRKDKHRRLENPSNSNINDNGKAVEGDEKTDETTVQHDDVNAMEEEMGLAAAADAEHDKVSGYSSYRTCVLYTIHVLSECFF